MSHHATSGITPESLLASGRSSEKLSLPSLQSKMKCDPEGYESELVLLYNQFNSSLELFQQQAAMSFTSISGIGSDSSVAKDLGDRAMFLAHVTPFYPTHLADFPKKLADLLHSAGSTLLSGLRCHLTQALILLVNRQIVDIGETLSLFMDLQTLDDRTLRKLAFDHVVHSIRRMNQKHKNEAKNRALQNVLFGMLQQEDVARAKQALITLCELHRRKTWFDDRTANAICTASFHPSSRIMIAALSFLLDYEKIENDEDSDDSSSEDESSAQPQVLLSKEAIYKAHHKGTVASKKKKKAKLQRAMRSLKRQQRMSSGNKNTTNYSPLNHLKDAQGFAEKLFSRLQNCNERFEVRMMMLKVITRTVGLHRLILLNLYPFLQKYVQPHQRDVTNLLAAAVQACHDMVPPDAVEPLFKQIVNQFVHDRSRPEAITVGLNVVRELCMRMPLLMTEELLQDLALYKKSHDKSVSIASRSLIALFREVCPSLLIKKDRGRPIDPKARPKAYGEVSVAADVPGLELLQTLDSDNDQEDDDADDSILSGFGSDGENGNEENQVTGDDVGSEDDVADGSDVGSENVDNETEDEEDNLEDNEKVDEDDGEGMEHDDSDLNISSDAELYASGDDDSLRYGGDDDSHTSGDDESVDIKSKSNQPSDKKRKFTDSGEQLNVGDASLRALKKLAKTDGILSNEDFQRIKELKTKKEAKSALAQHGLAKSAAVKVASSDQLSRKPMDPARLEVHVRKKLSKDERLALIRAGREDRGKYMARAAVKQKKTGGLSNRQKEHKKKMPLAAKRDKAAKSRLEKKKKHNRSGKQFRGRKAWK
ncbi:protein SDA1 homolog [Neltuma alba]|uniref:protein SDA1 homolog n=1 Tax=Neltuma alba TaxID=207710 RepID=UPI0010A40E91|nr:protein SDA1 homolog [Prosopis alba]